MSEPTEPSPLYSAEKLLMKETDPATIDAQIEAGIARENGSVLKFLANFHTVLPNGMMRGIVENMKRLDTLRDPSTFSELEWHSDRYKSETPREYFNSVDRAIIDSAVDPDELERLRTAHVGLQDYDEWLAAKEAYMRYALPVYRQLRMAGYSHYDLWH